METTTLEKIFTRNNIIIVLAILVVLAFLKKNEKMFNNPVEEDITEPEFLTNVEGFKDEIDSDDLSNFNLSSLELIEEYRINKTRFKKIIQSQEIPIIVEDKDSIKDIYDKLSDYLVSKITYKTLEPIEKYKSWHLIKLAKHNDLKLPKRKILADDTAKLKDKNENSTIPNQYSKKELEDAMIMAHEIIKNKLEEDFLKNENGGNYINHLSHFKLNSLELIKEYRRNPERLNNIVDALEIPINTKITKSIKDIYDKLSYYLVSKITYKTLEPIENYKSWHLIELAAYHQIEEPSKTLQIIEKNARSNSKNNQANPEEYSDIVMRHRHTLYKLIKIKLLEVANDVKSEKIASFESRETIMLNERDRLKKEQEREHDSNIKKYNKAFNDYLEYQENQKANINLLQVGKMVEDGIYSIFDLKSNDIDESFVGGNSRDYYNDDNDDN